MRIITFGSFDLFHIGHLSILQRAKALGDFLIVGVSTDALHYMKKSRYPLFGERERMAIIRSLECVDEVFREESLDGKAHYICQYRANVLVMGDDWAGEFDWCKPYCSVCYLPRTPNISTTRLLREIRTLEER